MKGKLKQKKGITLIALVITIIVLLILAGVSIATLTGENGILTQANEATEKTDIGEEKEKIKLAVTEAKIDDKEGYIDLTYENLQNTIAKQFGDIAEVIENADGSFLIKVKDRTYNVSVDGNVALKESNVKEYTADGVPIPKGFYYVEGTKEEGVVISDVNGDNMNNDAKGNQFVWVPVNSENFETEFVRKDFGIQNIPDEKFINTEPELQKYYEPTPDNTTATSSDIKDEVIAMYQSIKLNGGFYIGRYETGNENNNPVSKKMYMPWQLPFESTGESDGAKEKARQMYPNHSHLCYGVEWDAVMRWINEDINLKKYLLDSSDIGHYGTEELIETGSVKEYQIKNIFDMAGNASEWTMEMIGGSALTVRGGSSKSSGAERPITQRQSAQPVWTVGFRIAFYI